MKPKKDLSGGRHGLPAERHGLPAGRHGIVISDKMDKTIVVQVCRLKKHPKYKKRYKVTKKYKVHDPENRYKVGDKVSFIECRPLSKDKHWRVVYDSKKNTTENS